MSYQKWLPKRIGLHVPATFRVSGHCSHSGSHFSKHMAKFRPSFTQKRAYTVTSLLTEANNDT
jgi:hypothetical protein